MQKVWLWLVGVLIYSSSYANVVITGTRIVYPAEKQSITVALNNKGDNPALVQSWIDKGNADASPDQIKVPFVITPPIIRVEPKQGQSLRLTYTGEPLPSDRESVFYLNVLDIPPKPQEAKEGKNYLQIAIRHRLKLLFRPSNLPMNVEQSYQSLTWQFAYQAGKNVLTAHNPSPYYITFQEVKVEKNGHQFEVDQPKMVAPFADVHFYIPKMTAGSPTKVKWKIINDYGGSIDGKSTIKP